MELIERINTQTNVYVDIENLVQYLFIGWDRILTREEKQQLAAKFPHTRRIPWPSFLKMRCWMRRTIVRKRNSKSSAASKPRNPRRRRGPGPARVIAVASAPGVKDRIQSPREIPRARAVRVRLPSGVTVFSRPTALAIGTEPTCCPVNATIFPKSPAAISSTATAPNIEQSTRSNVVGLPPRCKWPSTQYRGFPCPNVSRFRRRQPRRCRPAGLRDSFLGAGSDETAAFFPRAFRNRDEREFFSLAFTFADLGANAVVGERDFRNQNDIRPPATPA